ncbi:MAG: NfeD family protein [Pseudomonadota bacterium]
MDSFILSWIQELGPWSWAVLGAILMILEVVIPGVFLIWIGVAAIALALQALVIPMPWQAQIVLFILYVAFFIWLSNRIQGKNKPKTDVSEEVKPETILLNERSAGLVGNVYVLQQAIANGAGKISVDDTVWRVKGPDTDVGESVRVKRADGAVLHVEPFLGDAAEDKKEA